MLVRDYMSSEVVTVAATDTVAHALDVFSAHDIRHLPVMDGTALLGIISDHDLRRAVTGRPGETEVGDVMTRSPVTVGPSTSVDDAARELIARKFGCLLVMEGERLVGLVTASDLLRALVDRLDGGP